MSTLTDSRSDRRPDQSEPPADEQRPPAQRPSIWTILGNAAVGILASGWALLWFTTGVIAEGCERDGVIVTCRDGGWTSEVNLVVLAVVALIGVVALLRAVVGVVLWLRPAAHVAEADRADQADRPEGAGVAEDRTVWPPPTA
jgi:hypothetical protein